MSRYSSLFNEDTTITDNQETGCVISDPRAADHWPEYLKLPEDSHLWNELLAMAVAKDELFAQNLKCFRIQGARIVPTADKKSYRLTPVIDPDGAGGDAGWENETVYREYAEKYLGPKKELLVELLAELRQQQPI